MPATLTFDSGWNPAVIDLTADDDTPTTKTNGVWAADLQAQVWEEPAHKRRRVDDGRKEDAVEDLEGPLYLSSQPTKTRDDHELPPSKITTTNEHESPSAPATRSFPTSSDNLNGNHSARCGPKRWFGLSHRPYLEATSREQIRRAIQNNKLSSLSSRTIKQLPYTYHVDFTNEEIEYVWQVARALFTCKKAKDPLRGLAKLVRKTPNVVVTLPQQIQGQGPVASRTELDLYYFLWDVNYDRVSRNPKVYTLRRPENDSDEVARARRIAVLRFKTELEGHSPFGRQRVFGGIKHDVLRTREDGLGVRAVWTGCAGDIATIAWVSDSAFVCGTTEHSDAHNQQYNRPGNLLVASISAGTLRAYPDHRVVRPLVARGENASEAMRQSQDPWLYSSVVSSAYDPVLDIAYTSSFDRTVKAWKVDPTGAAMELVGTWPHVGIVNFVATSHHQNLRLVATATDTIHEAIRIYEVNAKNVSASPYLEWGGRIAEAGSTGAESDVWAYYPATIQWGIAPICSHHILVGYSPRALSGDDNDIPESKRNTGELRMIDATNGGEVSMGIPMCQNIFEVLWHPTRPVCIVAMTVGASKAEAEVRTQVRVYALSIPTAANSTTGLSAEFYGFTMVLDCYSTDINELAINTNSPDYFYASAACTDGRVYVWDTSQGHSPIHVLPHGEPVEEYSGDREREDTGCKFTAWGATPDRLYTGGSDGVVKVWDITRPRPFVRDLLEVSGPVSAGAFSPDKSKLAIGDASGRVYLLSVDAEDNIADDTVKLPMKGGVYNTTDRTRSVHRPRPFIPHPEPAPPPGHLPEEETDLDSGILRARNFLQKGQLFQHKNPVLGVFQGPNYSELNLYRREAHWDENPSNPLLADTERDQQVNKLASRSIRRGIGSRLSFGRSRRVVIDDDDDNEAVRDLHRQNCHKELNWEELSEGLKAELIACGVDLTGHQDYGLEFEQDEYTDGSEPEEEPCEGDEGVSFSDRESWNGFSSNNSTRGPSPYLSTASIYPKTAKVQGFAIYNESNQPLTDF